MNIITTYVLFQVVIVIPFIIGYFINKKNIVSIEQIKNIIKINIFIFEPLIVLWSIWGLSFSFKLVGLPLFGFATVALGFMVGKLVSIFFNFNKIDKATFEISSSLANHGITMGGFICYLLLGEEGLGLSFIYVLYFAFFVYMFIFPYARYVSSEKNVSVLRLFKFLLSFNNMPLYATLIAILLQLFNVGRPRVDFPINTIVFISIALSYFMLGLTSNFHLVKHTINENIILTILKFIIIPVIIYFMLLIFDIPLNYKIVIFVQSLMPAAVYSVVTSVLYNLNTKFAGVLFIVNTLLFLIIVLPVIIFIIQPYLKYLF